MKTVEILKQTTMAGTVYKRGQVVTLRARAADAIVTRGDAWYRDAPAEPKCTQSPNTPADDDAPNDYRERARKALADAGAHVDARWGDNRLARELKEHKLKV